MFRHLALAAALLLATLASAATRTIESGTRPANGATAGGVVSSVSGNLIRLAGGAIVIDATGAEVMTDRGKQGSIADIEAGMIVFAALSTSDVPANAPLPASMITATRIPDATLFGPVQSVDAAASTITLLGRTVRITPDTSFGGIYKRRDSEKPGIGDILPNQVVQVTVDATGGQLAATSILVLTPFIPEVQATRGEVKSIGTGSWLIERERGDDLTVLIDAQTKIVGSPRVGDTVEVLYRVDSANANVAISIIKFERPAPPSIPDVFRFSGKVKSMEPAAWVITRESGDQQVVIDSISKIEPGIRVGDTVEVLAARKDDGTVIAIAIVRRR
jgi:Domain of unknown function (DUF5666)